MQISPTARVCPTCGAPLSFEETAMQVTCSYCQSVLVVDQTARQQREAAQKITKIILLFVGGIIAFSFLMTLGGMVMSCWMQQRIVSSVDSTQKRAMREACRARCPGECRVRDPKAKDIGPCIDTCQARCDKD